VLEDELLLVVGLENHTVLVEATHATRKFHATGQIDRNGQALFARSVQKSVLKVLARHLRVVAPLIPPETDCDTSFHLSGDFVEK
jgi:hypothetical protein